MSANITIQEGGQSKQFGHIAKLKTTQSGGGEVLWVPEEDVETKSLYVHKNGSYNAADGSFTYTKTSYKKKKNGKKKKVTQTIVEYDEDNVCYGYDEVSVNITDATSGKKDGKDYSVTVDDNGNLVEEEIPAYIRIVKVPDKTSYIVAEPISIAGIQVKAYYGDDSEWGDVPLEEITFDPLVATESTGDTEYATSDLDISPIEKPIKMHSSAYVQGDRGQSYHDRYYKQVYTPTSGSKMACFFDGTYGMEIFASRNDELLGTWQSFNRHSEDEEWHVYNYTVEPLDSYTLDGKTVYYAVQVGGFSGVSGSENFDNAYPSGIATEDKTKAAWTMIYGEISGGDSSNITVKWLREDGEELTDTFEITVDNPPIPIQEMRLISNGRV